MNLFWLLLFVQIPLGGITGGGVSLPTPTYQWNLDGCTTTPTGCTPSNSTTAYNIGSPGNPGTWHGTAAGGIASSFYDTATNHLSVAGHFNGTNNYVSATVAANGNNDDTNLGWIKVSSISGNQIILETRSGGGLGGVLYVDNATKKSAFFVNGISAIGPATNVVDGSWHCIAGTFTFATTSTIAYTDSVAGTPVTGTFNGFTGTTAFIGADFTGAPTTNVESMNYITDYHSQALTSTQISTVCGAEAFMVIPELFPLRRPYYSAEAITERQQFYGRKLAA